MAKINTSAIEGYEAITPEQKLAALESYEIPAPDYTGWVKKDVFDKTSKELAELKRGEKNSSDELAALKTEIEGLRKDKTVADYKAKYLAAGYPDGLAEETAKALADGDAEKVFENQKKFLTAREDAIKSEMMKKTPTPPAGTPGGNGGVDYQKKIDEARANGDIAAVAYYTRLQAQAAVEQAAGK